MRTLTLAIFFANAICAQAQWLNYPSPHTPLTKDGKPNLSAKAPRAANGKPDLSGVWQIAAPPAGEFERLFGDPGPGAVAGDDVRDNYKYFYNLLIDFPPGTEPLRPEAAARTLKNRQTLDTPTSHCLPYGFPARYFPARPFKIFQTADTVVMIFEIDGAVRQIHTDGRKLPADPFPSWIGYSVGKWEGDTLVVDTAGFNNQNWLDARGHPQSEALRVHERLHRRDFGHLDFEVTVEDPQVLTKPVTVKFTDVLIPNSDILESFCVEGERDRAHMPSATP